MAPRLRIDAAAFDLDGLMVNTEELHYEVGVVICRRRGKEFVEELRCEMMGQPGRVSLQIMIDYHGFSDTVDDLAAETKRLFMPLLDERLATMPGLLPLLDALERAGVPKCVATSSRGWFAEDVLERLNLRRRFAFVLTADDVTHGKPHPEMYLTAAERHGVPPGRMLVLEDSSHGTKAGAAAEALTIAVPGDHSRGHDFAAARLVANTLADPRLYEVIGLAPASSKF